METLDADVDPETETDAAELQNAPKHHGTPYIMCDQKSVAFPDHMPDTMPDTMESSLPRRNP